MHYSINYECEPDFFLVETQGNFNINSFRELAQELLTHEKWRPGAACLFDYRKSDFQDLSAEDLEKAKVMHQQNNEVIGKSRSALVMKNLVNFGIGRMYQGKTEFHVDTEFRIFTVIEDAVQWVTEEI